MSSILSLFGPIERLLSNLGLAPILREQIVVLREHISFLKTQVAALIEQNEALKKENVDLKSEVKDYKEKNKALEKDTQKLKHDVPPGSFSSAETPEEEPRYKKIRRFKENL